MKVSRRYHGGITRVSRGRILCVLYVAYSTQRRHYILTAWPEYAMMALVPVTGTMFASVEFKGEGRSAVRCCGLFSCLQLVPPAWGPAGKRRGPPSVGMPLLADAPTRLKRYAGRIAIGGPAAVGRGASPARRRGRRRKMPARRPFAPVQWCAAARGLVFRPLRRAVAAAGKEKAGLAAGFPGKRRIRTPFSCR